MDKAYNPQDHEEDIYKSWEQSGAFQPSDAKDSYTIAIPPPNVTGTLHAGHSMFLTIEDLLTRYHRMRGKSSLWIPGTDHAAIATESVVLKNLGIEDRNKEITREKFMEEAWKWSNKSHATITNQVRKMGASCDWSREAFTFDEPRNRAVNTIFKMLYEKGLIYRGNRMVNWSVGAQSVLADDEVEWEDVSEPFYSIKCGEFIIGTVRSETKCADSPVIVHPEGEYARVQFTQTDGTSEIFIIAKNLAENPEQRKKALNILEKEDTQVEILETVLGKDLVGMKFEDETYAGKRKFFVIADEVIDMEKGTGSMTISVNHSPDDYALAEKHNLKDYYIQKIDFEGNMTEVAGPCAGMPVQKARKVCAKLMKESGLLVGEDKGYSHNTPICYRSGTVVEPMVSKQWFIDVNKEFVDDFAEEKTQKIIFVRHGESEANIQKIFQGTMDSPLSEKGKEQAKETAKKLKGKKIKKIICSNLQRAKKTAEIIAKEHNLEIEIWEDLHELDFGNLTGKSFSIRNGKSNVECMIEKNEGETLDQILHRAKKVYEKIQNLKADGDILIVGHNYFTKAILSLHAEEDFLQFHKSFKLHNGECKEIKIFSNRTTLKKQMQAAVREDHVKIVPERFNKTYFHWIDNLRDWCISRQIWWGHRIPVWYDEKENIHLPREQKIILARHGEHEGNEKNIIGLNGMLTKKGKEQAEELAEKLKEKNITKIISSKNINAFETAKAVAEKFGLHVEIWDEFSGVDFGDVTGEPERRDTMHRVSTLEYAESKNTGENRQEIFDRVKKGWEKLKEARTSGEILLVSHRTILSALDAVRAGRNPDALVENRRQNENKNHGYWGEITALQSPDKFQEIYFVRHGQSQANIDEILSGHFDTPLTETEREQAKKLSKHAQNLGITKIITSPLQRAKKTGEIVAKNIGITETETWEEISEISLGNLEGTKDNNISYIETAKMFSQESLAESFEDLFERAKKTLEKCKELEKEEKVMIVSHGFFLAALKAVSEGVDSKDFLHFLQNWHMQNTNIMPISFESEKKLKQDEDTLDTWFSSALWPFSILGWPDKTPDFEKFYPTDVLETGYDILFFWVARMIMFGKFATGKYPFHTVYLHGLVCDASGQKMSKSKGNGVDPLKMIEEFGTDALRLSLLMGTTPGNNANLGSEKIAGCRNLCNKLWNISRFVLETDVETSIHGVSSPNNLDAINRVSTDLEKWLITKTNTLISDVTQMIDNYRFGEAAQKLWEFTWDDFADWAIEAAKPEKNETTPLLLRSTLETLLKLWHPFLPFVTEAIWKETGNEGMLITAEFPVETQDLASLKNTKKFELVRDVISKIRSMRKNAGVDSTKKITAYIGSPNIEVIKNHKKIICFMARLEELNFSDSAANLGKKLVNESGSYNLEFFLGTEVGIFLPSSGMINPEAERKRVEKELEKAEKQLAGIEGKLKNTGFLEKAPKALVEKSKKQAEELKEKIEMLKKEF